MKNTFMRLPWEEILFVGDNFNNILSQKTINFLKKWINYLNYRL